MPARRRAPAPGRQRAATRGATRRSAAQPEGIADGDRRARGGPTGAQAAPRPSWRERLAARFAGGGGLRPAFALGAVLLAVGIGAGFGLSQLGGDGTDSRSIVAAVDSARLPAGASARLVVPENERDAVLVVSGPARDRRHLPGVAAARRQADPAVALHRRRRRHRRGRRARLFARSRRGARHARAARRVGGAERAAGGYGAALGMVAARGGLAARCRCAVVRLVHTVKGGIDGRFRIPRASTIASARRMSNGIHPSDNSRTRRAPATECRSASTPRTAVDTRRARRARGNTETLRHPPTPSMPPLTGSAAQHTRARHRPAKP